MDLLLTEQREDAERIRKEKSGLSADTLAEQHRISDLRAKTDRMLADCDLLIIPRMTLFDVTRCERIPNRVYQLDPAQVDAIGDFLTAAKPGLACFCPSSERAAQ